MLNYKLERVLFVVVWIALICFFSAVIPPQTISLLIQYQYAASSLILAFLIFCFYRKISNHIILKKIEKLILQNEIKIAIDYVTVALKKHPRFCWLQVKKLELLILDGNICEYQTLKTVISCKKNSLIIYIKMLDNIVRFLQQSQLNLIEWVDDIDRESSLLVKTNYLLCKKDTMSENELVMLSSEIYNASLSIYRCIASIVLFFYYMKTDNKINQTLYYEKAISNSPSVEVSHLINSIFDIELNDINKG